MALSVHENTMNNELCIEEAPTDHTSCRQCNYLIERGDIRVTFYRSQQTSIYFHLHCFTPLTQVQINYERDVRSGVQRKMSPQNTFEVKKWIEDWNRRFDLTDSQIQEINRKFVVSTAPANKRILLEAFKFLTPEFLGNVVTRVCKSWYHVTWEDELWPDAGKVGYLFNKLHACVHCKIHLEARERYMICPVTNMPKCSKCYMKKSYRPQRLAWLKSRYGITRAYLNTIEAKVFQFDGADCVYLYQVKPLASRHRFNVVQHLLKDVHVSVLGQSIVDILKELTIDDMWTSSRSMRHDCSKILTFIRKAKKMRECQAFLKRFSFPAHD